ncbi:TPA: YgdI/YgdR family lipoprotein [Serratia marcescens]|uniref:YgdI/YgdR family lipoprotein n=1 Tax=Serratia marcescens TaxID=615 RepID=UPI0029D3C168|nr:YgdI/YgdR family lipoprotein [Serratia marcescens]
MKNVFVSMLLPVFVLSVTACSSDYVISTNDGHMLTTHGKPVIDKDTGLISYKDSDGNIHQVHQKDVKELVEK